MGVAKGGEARIQWAMEQTETEIRKAAARANNQANKIRSINIAAFGFSRGAAAARAFARRIADKSERAGARWVWKAGGHPVRLYFLGLFDTVASVGVPATVRKYRTLIPPNVSSIGWLPVLIASTADGHAAWAGNLRIPPMVERCVHYCAAHEIRNSFPLDTVLENGRYPDNCVEVFYPGAHSDVGGGYRPGEGGRNSNRFAMLSLVPLKAMYDEAIKAGVPLVDVANAEDRVKEDFLPLQGANTEARLLLSQRFNQYMNTVGWGGRSVGETVRAHMHMYFRWRIVHIGRKTAARQQGERDWETQRLEKYEAQLAAERREKQAELKRLDAAFRSASVARDLAWDDFRRNLRKEKGAAYEEAKQHHEEARWAKAHQEAVVTTMPVESEKLIAALDKYDRQFLQDSARVRAADPETLRPFAKMLRDAWEAEPLTDPEIIAFFDDYVTDSLAGFDTRLDLTRATEHRRLYQGGDATIDYAALRAEQRAA